MDNWSIGQHVDGPLWVGSRLDNSINDNRQHVYEVGDDDDDEVLLRVSFIEFLLQLLEISGVSVL